ncbi:MAG: hypothetical protein C4334_09970 [Pyrinomonas sp.]
MREDHACDARRSSFGLAEKKHIWNCAPPYIRRADRKIQKLARLKAERCLVAALTLRFRHSSSRARLRLRPLLTRLIIVLTGNPVRVTSFLCVLLHTARVSPV